MKIFRSIPFSLILLLSVLCGSGIGLVWGEKSTYLKPLGDIFLNLLFTLVVPLVFFSISAALANVAEVARASKTLSLMLIVFTITGIIASLSMLWGLYWFPIQIDLQLPSGSWSNTTSRDLAAQLVSAVTVNDFPDLWSKKNLLPMILFSTVVGISVSSLGAKAKPVAVLLNAGNEVMLRALSILMIYAPIGLGAYFAYYVGVVGSSLLGPYINAVILYFVVAILYFFIGFSGYAFFAAGMNGLFRFWSNIVPAALFAFSSGSSVATIPLNIAAARKTGVPDDVSELVIPIGATIHMDGSCLAAILKIAVLAQVYHFDIVGLIPMMTAVGIALISSVVMSGIPGGGFLGEAMIVGMYGLPFEAIPLITMIGTLVDAPATAINSIGDNVCSMMIARLRDGKKWMRAGQ